MQGTPGSVICMSAATQSLLFEGEPLNAKGKKASVTTVPTVEGFPLTRGKKGELVTRVQSSLTVLGYYSGKVDGVYGASSVTAVKKFQQKNGLTATGTADAAVQSLLFGGSPLSASATATPKPTATPVPDVIGWTEGKPAAQEAEYPFETVTLDSVNLRKKASVTSARLATLPKGASVTVSALQGDFALITYQTKKKTYTGYVMSQYVDIPAIYLGGKELPEDADAQKKYVGLSAGASGDAVTALQNALRELGFYTAVSTGYYDDATTLAVKAMQRKNDILQTGNASAELQKLIFEGKPLNMKGAKTDVKELPPYDGVSMRQGDTGYQVAELQEALTTLGFYEGVLSGVYDAATAAAVKASAGATEYVKIARVVNISSALNQLKAAGLWIAGADMSGETMRKTAMKGPLAIVIGNEGEGLSKLVRENCDFLVSIPMQGHIDSLNAGVAAAILMFEKKRQDAE